MADAPSSASPMRARKMVSVTLMIFSAKRLRIIGYVSVQIALFDGRFNQKFFAKVAMFGMIKKGRNKNLGDSFYNLSMA